LTLGTLTSVDALDTATLSALLATQYPGVRAEALLIREVIGGHTTKVRVTLDYNDVGAQLGLPRDLCIKANWSGDALSSRLCILEAHFYRHIRDTVRLPIPRSTLVVWDERGRGQGLVAMEDLHAGRGQFGDPVETLGVDAVAGALTQLAGLHAALWDSPRLDRYAWLPRSMARGTVDAQMHTILAPFIACNLGTAPASEPWGSWLPGDHDRLDRAYGLFVAQEQAIRTPLCLIHGDAHHANNFVRSTGDRLWLDWQFVRRGAPWRDVATFTISALEPGQRHLHEQDLLRHYLRELATHGVPDAPGFDLLWSRYRAWPIWGMVTWLSRLQEPDASAMARRFCCAAEDFGTLELIEQE